MVSLKSATSGCCWLLVVITNSAFHGTFAFVAKPKSLGEFSTTSLQESPRHHPFALHALENDNDACRVAIVAGDAPSGFGKTSPQPNPSWMVVARHLANRLPNFSNNENDAGVSAAAYKAATLQPSDLQLVDIVVALGVVQGEEGNFSSVLKENSKKIKAVLADPTCSPSVQALQRAGSYSPSENNPLTAIPWSTVASHKRLLDKTNLLLKRSSSEDYIFAILFAIHALVTPLQVVKSDINPSWEKGVLTNIKEFYNMVDCCGPQILAALSDTRTKQAIDLLNAVDLRDQVGSYRVIVSNETPQLEEFTLCILQQNNCFECDAPILTRPRVEALQKWRGRELTQKESRQILMGHLHHDDAHGCSQKRDWSWKIVAGANPAYDAFPMQHQIFYPSGKGTALWYDPVFCVETLQNTRVWCKRHYRCTPKKEVGKWILSTLDNGMVSEEHWTIVDAADDLSWAVLHYSGAAKKAGQSYVGALLCSPNGKWPSKDLERIKAAFERCDLELWELFGSSTEQSFMWSDNYTEWALRHPPPLDRIGDISITTWRKQEREKAKTAAAKVES